LAQGAEIISVMVPATEGERHATSARFHESAGNEHVFHELGAAVVAVLWIAFAVAGADLFVLLFKVKRVDEFAGGEDAESLFVEGIEPVHHTAGIDVSAKLVEA